MRTVIDVPDDMIETLNRVSVSKKQSRASIIREALAKYVDELNRPNLNKAFGIWGAKSKDGVAYQDDLRNEWAGK